MQRPTKQQINELPLYTGLSLASITVVENEIDAQHALSFLQQQACLGFDTESKPIFRKGQSSPGPTLIQLSTLSQAFLFPTRFAAALCCVGKLLNNPDIKKVGFGIKNDHKELALKFNMHLNNIEDVSLTLKRLACEKNPIGAKAAVAMILNSRLSKAAQKSNWGAYPLKRKQLLYAANDAHCAINVAQSLASIQRENKLSHASCGGNDTE